MRNYKISGTINRNVKLRIFSKGKYIGYYLTNGGDYKVVFKAESSEQVYVESESVAGVSLGFEQITPIETIDSTNIMTI